MVGDASRGSVVANYLCRFGQISSVGNAGRVSAREQMAREVVGEPSLCLVFECVPIQPFHGWPTMFALHATVGVLTLHPRYYDV